LFDRTLVHLLAAPGWFVGYRDNPNYLMRTLV
jgi:hypothetical protein